MGNGLILVLNAGSSSLKFAAYKGDSEGKAVCRGQIDYNLSDRVIRFYREGCDSGERMDLPDYYGLSREESVRRVIDWFRGNLVAVGHRVVHGGDRGEYALVNDEILLELEGIIPLAPLHQPFNLDPIRILRKECPDVPQVVCFDTAFHRTQSSLDAYALPAVFAERHGIKRYGFHGLSYEYISKSPWLTGNGEKVVVCHLGNGASLCWMRLNREGTGYESCGCTLGYSTLDGLPMGTRVGCLDPEVVLTLVSNADSWGLVREGESPVSAVRRILLKESGLLGISGVSSDMARLLDIFTGREAADFDVKQAATRAIQIFVRRVACEIVSAAVKLGGIDQLVFTAGIGEHASRIRLYVCDLLVNGVFPSLRLDEALNTSCVGGKAGCISRKESGIRVLVVPTDENRVILDATRRIIGLPGE